MIDLLDFYVWKLTHIKQCPPDTSILDDIVPKPQTPENKVFQYWSEVKRYMRSSEYYKKGFDEGYQNYSNIRRNAASKVFGTYQKIDGEYPIPTQTQCLALGYSEGYDKREADDCTRILESKEQIVKKTESPKTAYSEILAYIKSTDDYKTGFRAGYEQFDIDTCSAAMGYVDGYRTKEANNILVFNGLDVVVAKKEIHPEVFDKKNFRFS